jgi:hypothetical protein
MKLPSLSGRLPHPRGGLALALFDLLLHHAGGAHRTPIVQRALD